MIYNLLSEPLTINVGGNKITLQCSGYLDLHNGSLRAGSPGYNALSRLNPGDAIIVEEKVADHIAKFCDLKMTLVFTAGPESLQLQYRGLH